MIGALYLLSLAFGGLAVALVIPLGIALATGDAAAEAYLLVSALTGFGAGGIYFALRGRTSRLDRRAAFTLIGLVWIALPAVAAVPFALRTDIGYVGALFEAVSGFTTTGATIFRPVSRLSAAGIFWRAELQWMGGLLTLVMFVAIVAPSGAGGLSSRGITAVGGFGEAGVERLLSAVRTLAAPYALLTLLCFGLLVAGRIPAFDAACLALSTISTGGFMPRDGTMSAYGSPFAESVVTAFMAIGATSFVWQRMVIERRKTELVAHRETYWLLAVMAAVALIYAWEFSGGEGMVSAFGEGLFNSVSLVSSSGFETRPGGLSMIPGALVLLLALAGAAALSTGGGVKLYRVGAMLVQSMHEMRRLVFPHSVRSTRFGSQPYDLRLMKGIWVNLALSLAVVAGAALLLSLRLPAFDAAMVAAISALSNVGPLYSADWAIGASWPAYADFGVFAQIVTIATMILGRIEVVALFAAIASISWSR
jgi:trk system potassium uptake protein TrkH